MLLVLTQDGGKAAQKMMQPSPQSVDELKKILADAHKKQGAAPAKDVKADFNEEDYIDQMDDMADEIMHE